MTKCKRENQWFDLNEKTNGLIYIYKANGKIRPKPNTTSKLQAPNFEQAHTKCK